MFRIFRFLFGLVVLLALVMVAMNNMVDRKIETEVVIEAPREAVWQILTDNTAYGEWNPLITASTGEVVLGGSLENTMTLQGKETVFQPEVTALDAPETFEWKGSGLGGTFKGNHYFRLDATDDGYTRMVHGEEFSGMASGLLLSLVKDETVAKFEAMNQALKERAERAVAEALEAEAEAAEADGASEEDGE